MNFTEFSQTVKMLRKHAWYSMVGLQVFVKTLKSFEAFEVCKELTDLEIHDAIQHESCLIGGQMTGLVIRIVGAVNSLLKGVCVSKMGSVPGDTSWFSHETFALVTGVRLNMLSTWPKVEMLFVLQEQLVSAGGEFTASAGELLDATALVEAFGEEMLNAVKDMEGLK